MTSAGWNNFHLWADQDFGSKEHISGMLYIKEHQFSDTFSLLALASAGTVWHPTWESSRGKQPFYEAYLSMACHVLPCFAHIPKSNWRKILHNWVARTKIFFRAWLTCIDLGQDFQGGHGQEAQVALKLFHPLYASCPSQKDSLLLSLKSTSSNEFCKLLFPS